MIAGGPDGPLEGHRGAIAAPPRARVLTGVRPTGPLHKDDAATVRAKVMGMFTDPTRLRATDPGHVEGNPVFDYHEAFNSDRGEVEDLEARYRRGAIGDVLVNKRLVTVLEGLLGPIRERRRSFEASQAR